MKVKIKLQKTSQPPNYDNVENTYQKGDFYCIYLADETVKKFPIQDIFSITEDYVEH
jgi:hypothetical protein